MLLAFIGGGPPRLVVTLTDGATINGGTLPNGLSSPYGESTVTIDGGTPSYSGGWVLQSGSSQITPVNASSLTTQWQSTGTNEVVAAVYRFEATDAGSQEAVSDPVNISATHGTPE